uniref:Uncharacterized protein n=1 Tax=Anopheles epiroticus TaxID=199890 RepID=A0A182PDW4_9DIPT
MKKSTRSALWLCLVLLAIATAPLALSDEGDEQEQDQTSQEAVAAQEEQDNPAPEGEAEATDGEATNNEETGEVAGLQPSEFLPQQINILLAPTACKPGYRVDHKGKCRPSL